MLGITDVILDNLAIVWKPAPILVTYRNKEGVGVPGGKRMRD